MLVQKFNVGWERFIYDCIKKIIHARSKKINIGWERFIYACKKIFVDKDLYMIAQNFNVGWERFIYGCIKNLILNEKDLYDCSKI